MFNLRLLRNDIALYLEGYEWGRFSQLNPINFLEGLHKDFTFWMDAMPFESENDYQVYLTRLRALATQINEQINLMKQAMRVGWTNHRLSMVAVIDEISVLLNNTSTRQSIFFRPFADQLGALRLSANKREMMRAEAEVVINDQVITGYIKLKQFIHQEYLPSCRQDISIAILEGGASYYKACLKWYLSYNVKPNDLYAIGRARVNHILHVIDQIRRDTGYVQDLGNFLRYVRSASKFLYRDENELLNAYRHLVTTEIPVRLKKLFHDIEMPPIVVQPMLFDGPLAVLMPGSEDFTTAAVFFVNVQEPFKQPKWSTKSTVLRETLPGRYLLTISAWKINIPNLRRWREYRKMFSVPFHFSLYSAFTDGWALYAESLGTELGFVKTNQYDDVGFLFTELHKACEMVVDSGIHGLGWSTTAATDYLTTTLGLTADDVDEDLRRIVTFPGQAAASEYGYLKIREIRSTVEDMFGLDFDIKDFHAKILRLGPVPLDKLETEMLKWAKLISSSSATSTRFFTTCLILTTLSFLKFFCFDANII